MSSNDMDHALLAVGSSGSSVLVPLDDVAGVWLEHLDLARDSGIDLQPAIFGMSSEPESSERRDYTRPEGSPRSRGDSVHSSPYTASISASGPSPSFSHLYSFPRTVTPALLALLPSAQHRPILLDVLGSVLRMHPSLNFPHFRARVMAMFSEGGGPEEIGIGPSRDTEKPTLSFFAAVTAGFALALQCSPGAVHMSSPRISHTPPSPTPCSSPSVSSLLSLSAHTLDLIEDSMPYDLEFLHALILRCLCMLHDGMPRVSQTVFATVGKMVNVARLMGLGRDPDEFTCGAASKYSLWEAEMRRRMWWDVFYYDV
jgi:Fungal specific transcription factor domain